MRPVVVAKCQQLPCEIKAFSHFPHPGGPPTFELVLPFLITIFIIVLTVVLSNQVKERAEAHLKEGWTVPELDEVEGHKSPETYAQAFPWVVDAAQIPSLIGTPLAGLLVLRSTFQLEFITAYFGVIVVGIILFVHFLRVVDIYGYKDKGMELFGYQVSPLAIGGIVLNVLAILAAIFVVR
jgi:hypothetical protein